MYVITEWFERYEVNEHVRPAKPGDTLRAKPLDYIRSKVHGRKMSAGFARMQSIAGERAYEVFGYFHKFLEIAGCEKSATRGKLLTHQGKPATAEDLAFDLRAPLEQVKNALSVLTNPQVAWVQELTENPAKSAESRKNRGVLYKSKSKSKTNRSLNKTTHARARAHAREEPPAQDPPAEQPAASTIARADSFSTSTRRFDSTMERLTFANELRDTLGVRKPADFTALWNFQHWLESQGDGDLFERALAIAKDSQNGRNALAVFFSRADRELGYRARVQADKSK